MSIETAEATAFNPATDNPSDPAGTFLPPTASHAAKSLSLFISGKPLLSDRTLALYTRIIREGMDHQSYTPADWNAALGLDAENPLGDVVLRTLENRVSDNDAVLESSKTLETQLREKFGAEGRGLHEYTSNVESALPENLVKTLHWIATRRNGIVHGEGDGFQNTQERARFVLQAARGWNWLAEQKNQFSTSSNDDEFIYTGGRAVFTVPRIVAQMCLLSEALGGLWLMVAVWLNAAYTKVVFTGYLVPSTGFRSTYPVTQLDVVGIGLLIIGPVVVWHFTPKTHKIIIEEPKKVKRVKKNSQTV